MSQAVAYSRLAGVYDELVVDPCFGQWARFLDRLWSVDPVGVRSVLDVCCGTGLMAAELIPRGIDVVGVDASAAMLARARALLGPDVRLEEAVLPDLPVAEVFDAAISTFDGLNYLTLADLRTSLEAIARCVRPDGWLVFDLHTEAMMQTALAHAVIEGTDADLRYVIRNVVDPETRVIDSTIEVEGPTEAASFTETHRQYFHTDEQVRSALVDAGFVVTRVADEYTDEPAGDATLRATWIARKGPA